MISSNIHLPRVTVLIVTYNYVNFIGYAIESIIKQTYPLENIEIIIVDDGSKDKTNEKVELYRDKVEIKYHYQENKGKAAATNLGLQYVSGEILFILDADDYYYPQCIETVVSYYLQSETIIQVSHLAHRLEEPENTITQQLLTHKEPGVPIDGINLLTKNIFLGYNVGLGSTFSVRTKIIKNIKIPDEVDMYIDYYMFLAIAGKGKIIQLDKYLSVFRRHKKSYSEGSIKSETIKIRKKRYAKSAKAIFLEISKTDFPENIKYAIELFYLNHEISLTYIERVKYTLRILFVLFALRSNPRFIKNNLKQLIKSYLWKLN